MKKSKFTEEQIAYALKQAELGTPSGRSLRFFFAISGHRFGHLGEITWSSTTPVNRRLRQLLRNSTVQYKI
ncbi:hypothetical protein [Burkholderia diffusa]|uniref:hypothetical protein n=1 Tax=Burkholderia diffusa TaxID=488732 RepID=UPI0012491FAD|nr:hypothetical protein [Burkholderia diffusa]KAB0656469.1 hypothetical protein F7R23_13895 [Burkholderia diffusa]MBM2654132.1 hypothetical protein [Burkholderia diffusa]